MECIYVILFSFLSFLLYSFLMKHGKSGPSHITEIFHLLTSLAPLWATETRLCQRHGNLEIYIVSVPT